jgi:RimJ/RimL family protein N-acetyltransferase
MLQPSLTTQRLLLRPHSEHDLPAIEALAGDFRIAATTGNVPHPYTEEAARSWLATQAPAWAAGSQVHFAIVDRRLDELRGALSLRRDSEGTANIGYWIGVPYWGQGLATEACAALVAFGFECWALTAINGRHLPENPASGRVLLKNGFRAQGRIRAFFPIRGQEEELDTYLLTREDWLTRPLD